MHPGENKPDHDSKLELASNFCEDSLCRRKFACVADFLHRIWRRSILASQGAKQRPFADPPMHGFGH